MKVLAIEGAIAFVLVVFAIVRLLIRQIRTDKMEAYIRSQARIQSDDELCENCGDRPATEETDDMVRLCEECYAFEQNPELWEEWLSMYFATNNPDGTVSLWYPDGDGLCRLQDNPGLDIYAKDLAPKLLEALNRETRQQGKALEEK